MIGRKEEQRLLNELAASGEAEFVVIYGRRRIGKTYLVRETFEDGFFFSYTGVANRNARQQRTDLALRGKIEAFRNETKTLKALHLTMITTYGVKQGKYAGIVQSEVNMDELIK